MTTAHCGITRSTIRSGKGAEATRSIHFTYRSPRRPSRIAYQERLGYGAREMRLRRPLEMATRAALAVAMLVAVLQRVTWRRRAQSASFRETGSFTSRMSLRAREPRRA